MGATNLAAMVLQSKNQTFIIISISFGNTIQPDGETEGCIVYGRDVMEPFTKTIDLYYIVRKKEDADGIARGHSKFRLPIAKWKGIHSVGINDPMLWYKSPSHHDSNQATSASASPLRRVDACSAAAKVSCVASTGVNA
eukprot:scaffold12163_cov176-Amphora_coffeaeformis.AAC.9